jgi:hypothetical protein
MAIQSHHDFYIESFMDRELRRHLGALRAKSKLDAQEI